jgi:protein gp37
MPRFTPELLVEPLSYYQERDSNPGGIGGRVHDLLEAPPGVGLVPDRNDSFRWKGQSNDPQTPMVAPAERNKWISPILSKERWLANVSANVDPFSQGVSEDLLLHVMRFIHHCPWHQWQIVTDRPRRMNLFMRRLYFGDYNRLQLADQGCAIMPVERQAFIPNLWLGVAAGETESETHQRLAALLNVKAAVRFFATGPTAGPVNLAPFIDQLDLIVDDPCAADPNSSMGKERQRWTSDLHDLCMYANKAMLRKGAKDQAEIYLPSVDLLPFAPEAELDNLLRYFCK